MRNRLVILGVLIVALVGFSFYQSGIQYLVGDLQLYNNAPNSDYSTAIAESPTIRLDGSAGAVDLGVGNSTDPTWRLEYVAVNQAGLAAGDSLSFEGATADAFESILSSADVGQDVLWLLPDVTSGSATVGDISVSYAYGATAADHLDTIMFLADRPYTVTDIDAVWGTAEATGAMAIQVERLQATEACTGGAGDDLLSATIDGTTTANTVNNGTLTATTANLNLSAGDRLCINLTATPNEIANLVVTVGLVPN